MTGRCCSGAESATSMGEYQNNTVSGESLCCESQVLAPALRLHTEL